MLVLVDGRSVYIDVQGFVFWKGLPITLPEIKQIEVIKGQMKYYEQSAALSSVSVVTNGRVLHEQRPDGTDVDAGAAELAPSLHVAPAEGGAWGSTTG